MKNKGLFSTLFIEDVRDDIKLDDHAKGRMATLTQTWRGRDPKSSETLWNTFMKQALGYLQFVPANAPTTPGVYSLFEDFGFSNCLAVLYLLEPGADIDDVAVGRFWPAKLLRELKQRKLNWGILTDGAQWRLYSTKSARPYEDFVELPLAEALENANESEYALFERFFHKDSFLPEADDEAVEQKQADAAAGVYKCRLDRDGESSEETLQDHVKGPLLYQVDEVLQYLCNGLIADTPKKGAEYTEEERAELFQSAVKLLYRCLFLFYAEARRLLPSESEKAEKYNKKLSIHSLCEQARKFRWGQRKDHEAYDLWKHLKGLIAAVNTGDPEYGIMGYDGGLFDDAEERFLGRHKLRNDFLARALYLLAYVEPLQSNPDDEYEIPYADLEVRHLGEMYENILEFAVVLADADRIRRRTKDAVEILLASETTRQKNDTVIRKGDVYFGETALERKQTGSYYTPQALVRFLNEKAIIVPLRAAFEDKYRKRFDQLLKEARSGYDDAARRGAASSAAALVEQFVNEVVLPFKVCDLGMGSGHFLVDAANQIAGLIVELLAEIPDVKGLRLRITSDPNYWRRLVTRHCLYGLDLNPLAVNLARLSLWLNCFATDHKLTFLDHHVRCGNSLIGIRSIDDLKVVPKRSKDRANKTKGPLLPKFDDLSETLTHAARSVAKIAQVNEDDTERQKQFFDEARHESHETLKPLADLFTAFLMDSSITQDQYRELFTHFASRRTPTEITNQELKDTWKRVKTLQANHHFFHWALEFPDVFTLREGFDATVGNPPWDILQPNSQEFYLQYDPSFRSYTKQQALARVNKLHAEYPHIAAKWETYVEMFTQASAYCSEPAAYACLTKGKIDLYRAFLERLYQVLQDGGRMAVVAPGGICVDSTSQALRELLFRDTSIQFIYDFENRLQVFTIHSSFRFVLLSVIKGKATTRFRCAFFQQDPQRLPSIESRALTMSGEQVRRFSPDTLSLMAFRDQRALDVTVRTYADWPLLRDQPSTPSEIGFRQELNMTSDSHLFKSAPTNCPLFEGKMIWQFDAEFSAPRYWLDPMEVREYLGPAADDASAYRLAFRATGESTNERNFIGTVIPEHRFCGNSMLVCTGMGKRMHDLLILCGMINSFVLDFVIRQKIARNINMFYVFQLPFPNLAAKGRPALHRQIVARVARLTCTNRDFASLWRLTYDKDWRTADFWYPKPGPNGYGPAHEQDIRTRLADCAADLTESWTKNHGANDRSPDRRDTGDRAQLRAELDAYTAHLYGLSHDDFAYLLDAFPVLRRKEEDAFGEFVSKRKCLEEYDRLAKSLNP